MASSHKQLSPRDVEKLLGTPGRHAVGGGLYLQVGPSRNASWLYRWMRGGKERVMGLGSYADVTLVEARKQRDVNRALLHEKIDPIERRKGKSGGVTFKEVAEKYIEAHRPDWTNPKHGAQWGATLEAYVYKQLGSKPAREITREDVLSVLRPIWLDKVETASRVRGRIATILSAVEAAAKSSPTERARWEGWSNPALWSHLRHDLPRRSKVAPVQHHPAVDFEDAPDVMAKLPAVSGIGTLALRFTIFTAARPEMVYGARWDEIKNDTWKIPLLRDGKGSGLKGVHWMRIPLQPEALAILDEMRVRREGDLIFPGIKPGRPISNRTMLKALCKVQPGTTVHGWRSTFRDWAGEVSSFPSDLIEAALNHKLPGGETREAYQRGDLLRKRRELMNAWATYLTV